MNIQKIWDKQRGQIILNIASIALISVVFFGGLIVVNKNRQLIDVYNDTVDKVQQQYDGRQKDAPLDLMMENWHRLGDRMMSNDNTIGFVFTLSGLVLIGANFMSLYYVLKRNESGH